jgi:hypothetical protein
MSPLQRLLSARGPAGVEIDLSHIPPWAMPDTLRRLHPTSPSFAASFFAERAQVLADALARRLDAGDDSSEGAVDAVVSLAERLLLVSVPPPQMEIWLRVTQHHGHTISGDLQVGAETDPILAALAARLGSRLQITTPAGGTRNVPNARWLARYGLAAMDVDALSSLVFCELYVPLTVLGIGSPIKLSRQWLFPTAMAPAVEDYVRGFDSPIWAPYKVEAAGPEPAADGTYSYNLAGLPGVEQFNIRILVGVRDECCELQWDVSFSCADERSLVRACGLYARAAAQMTGVLERHFGPGG